MLRIRVLILLVSVVLASTATAAGTARVAWEAHVPTTDAIIWFAPDEAGGVAIVTSDNIGSSRLFWIDHSGRTIFSVSAPSQIYFIGASAKGIAFLDPVSSRIMTVDTKGVATPLSDPDELAPPFPLAVSPNFAKLSDARGFFVQVQGTSDMTIRRYEW